MHKADFYEELTDNAVRCTLCPQNCIIRSGNFGACKVRKNIDGILFSEVYGKVTGYRFDPIEKKPLYHFYPGSSILSVGSFGCNLKCLFCQNCDISQPSLDNYSNYTTIDNEKILNDCLSNRANIGIAYTYNEPTVWYEFMSDLAIANKKNGKKNVMVSNGYINEKPLEGVLDYMDAFNIDLKAFDNKFYKKNTKSSLAPVLQTLKKIRNAGKHLEITNLVIPFENDKLTTFKEMVWWINDNLGENTILHLSRYFPQYKFTVSPTSPDKLNEFYEVASELLNYVYLGNVNSEKGSDTYCPSCKSKIIRRLGYSTSIIGLDKNGNCKNCSYPIDIISI